MKNTDAAKSSSLSRPNILPLRKREQLQPNVLPAKGTKKGWDRLQGDLQQNTLTGLCFDDELSPEIIARVPIALFDSEIYRTIAQEAANFYQRYGEAPKDHLPDLVEGLRSSSNRTTARMYRDALHDLHDFSKSLNTEFVRDQLGDFICRQVLRQTITTGAEELQSGDLQATISALSKGLQRTGTPQTRGLLGLDAAVHTYGEFHDMEFPQVESAMFPVLDHPGITQINGFRGHGKTLVAMYMAVGLASGFDIFGWKVKQPYRVFYVEGEMPPATPQKRLEDVIADQGVRPKKVFENLTILPVIEGLLSAPINLADPAQTEELVEHFSRYDIVFLDSITALTFDIDMNDAKDWQVINKLCMRCRGNGTSIVRLQHLGKDRTRGGIGSIMQEFPLNFCLKLEQETPKTFHANAIIHATCTKIREHAVSDFKPVDLELSKGRDGQLQITHSLAFENKTEKMLPEILELMASKDWKSVNKNNFAVKYGAERTTVYRAAHKAEGLLNQRGKENSLVD